MTGKCEKILRIFLPCLHLPPWFPQIIDQSLGCSPCPVIDFQSMMWMSAKGPVHSAKIHCLHQPTHISLSPVAPFTLQLCSQGFSSQPRNLTPNSDFGLPSSPVRNHHGSNHIPPTAAHARAENQYLGSLLKLFNPIPKQITDKLVKLETMSEDVVTRLERLEKQASLIKHLTTRSKALEETVQQLTEQNRTLETAVQDQEETINKLFAYLEKYSSCVLENSDKDSHMKNHKT